MSKQIVYFHQSVNRNIYIKALKDSKNIIEGIRNYNGFIDGIIDAFENLGYEVIFDYQVDFFMHQDIFTTHKLFHFLKRIYKKTCKRFDQYFFNKLLQKKVIQSGATIYFTELNPVVSILSLKYFKQNNIKTVEWFGLFPFHFKANDNRLLTAPFFDLIVSSANIFPHFKSKNRPKKFLEVPPAYNPKIFKKYEFTDTTNSKYKYDVLFIGSVSNIHSNRWDILELVSNKYKNFAFYGYGIENVPSRYTFIKNYRGEVWTHEYARIVNTSKIVLNLFLNDYDKLESGINQRAFEIPACGSFQLCEYIPNLEAFFTFGKNIEIFKNKDELIEKIAYYLSHENERNMIAFNGYQIAQKHTYETQLKQILGTL